MQYVLKVACVDLISENLTHIASFTGLSFHHRVGGCDSSGNTCLALTQVHLIHLLILIHRLFCRWHTFTLKQCCTEGINITSSAQELKHIKPFDGFLND